MRDYTETMETGDNAPNVIPFDLTSNLIRMINREEIDAGGPMPPTKALKPELIEMFERWVLAGAPNTAEEAAAAAATLTPEAVSEPTEAATPTP
jgi:hypothetical protein